MAAYKDESRHYLMSWLLLRPHSNQNIKQWIFCGGFGITKRLSDGCLSASSMSSNILPLSCINCGSVWVVVCIYWAWVSINGLYILFESVQLVDCACFNRCMLIINCVLFNYDTVYNYADWWLCCAAWYDHNMTMIRKLHVLNVNNQPRILYFIFVQPHIITFPILTLLDMLIVKVQNVLFYYLSL